MAETFKILAQSYPGSNVLTDLYTAPSQASVSSLVIANAGALTAKVRVTVAQVGAADADKQTLVPSVEVPANTVWPLTIGVTLGTGDIVRCLSSTGTVAFNLFGLEVS